MISLPTNPHKNEGYLMDSIPSILQSIIETHMLTLLYWFSEELYRRLWRQAEGHFLVRLCEQMDWKALEAA